MRKFNTRNKQSEAINPDLLWTLKTDCDHYRILNLVRDISYAGHEPHHYVQCSEKTKCSQFHLFEKCPTYSSKSITLTTYTHIFSFFL